MSEPTLNQLARQVAVLEEKMNTKHAEYRTDMAKFAGETRNAVDRLAGEIRSAIEQMNVKMAERDVKLAERDAKQSERDAKQAARDTRMLLIVVSLVVSATTVLGLLIEL